MSFVDKERVEQLIEKLTAVYLEMGMTVIGVGNGVDENGDLIIQTTALVRETAYEKLSEDLDVRKAFAKQMAEENQRAIEQKAKAIEDAAVSGSLLDVLTGERALVECSHERTHEGLCLDCREEIDET